MLKTALKFGFFAGLIMTVIGFVSLALSGGENPDYGTGEILGYTSMVLSSVMVVVGIYQYREKTLGGTIGFGKALKLGTLISIVAGLMFVLFDVVYVQAVNPDFMQEYMDYTVAQMEADGATQTEIDAMIAEYEAFQGPMGAVMMEVVMFLTVFFIEFIVALIGAGILSRKKNAVQTNVT